MCIRDRPGSLHLEPAGKQRGLPALKAGNLLPRQIRQDRGGFGVALLDLLLLAPEVRGIEPRGAIKRIILVVDQPAAQKRIMSPQHLSLIHIYISNGLISGEAWIGVANEIHDRLNTEMLINDPESNEDEL